MIRLRDILKELFADEFGKNRWVNLPHSKLQDYAESIIDLIKNAYADKGGNFELNKASDLQSTDLNYWIAIDSDEDPDADSTIAGKKTPAGTKLTAMGQDGTKEAKKTAIQKLVSLMKTKGFYAEMDKDLAQKLGLDIISDERVVRRVINKELTMNADGSFSRRVSNGPIKTKVLVGIPKQ